MAGSMCGRGVCGREAYMAGACVAGDVCGREACMAEGHAW